MRKSTTTILVFILLVLAAGYTFFWFKKADELKVVLEGAISRQNEMAKEINRETTFIRYDSITASGYPFTIRLNILKPVFDIPLSAMLQDYRQKNNPQAAAPANIVFEVSYDDRVSLSSNIMANYFTMEATGNSAIKPIVNNEARDPLITVAATPLLCHLGIYNPDNMPWNIPQSFSSRDAFLSALRSADCAIAGASHLQSGTPLGSVENFAVGLTADQPDSVSRKITFTADVKNSKSLPAFDEIANSYLQLLYDAKGIPRNQRGEPVNFSQYGVQNSTIDVSYEGPADMVHLTDPSAYVNLVVGAFDSRNDLYDVKNKARFTTDLKGDGRTASLVVHSSLKATPQYEQILTKAVSKILTDASASPALAAHFSKEISKPGDADAIAMAVVPKLHDIGEIHFDADIDATGSKDKNIIDNGNITINQLDLTTNLYGLKVKGGGKTSEEKLPVGALMVTCILCDAMMDNIGEYAIGVDAVLAKSRPGQTAYVTKPLVEGIKQFFHAINVNTENKDSKDVAVHIVADDQGKVTISGKQLLEVIGLFGVSAGQSLQQHAPVAVMPAPPKAP